MSLLRALKLPPLKNGAADAKAAAEGEQLLAGFAGEVRAMIGDKHPAAEEMRKLAVAAGADAKAGLWEEVKNKIAAGKKAIEEITQPLKDAVDKATQPAKDAKKVVDADFGSETPTGSAVDPGAAEQSFKEFADDVKSTAARLKQAQEMLAKVKGESEAAKAIGKTADALGKVADGLGKVGDGAGKVLEVAAAARKLEECRQVLARVQEVDFTKTENRVENAKAMGDLAKLFGEFGAEASKELPMLKGYFQLISRVGEIWVPIARMTDRREKEWMDAADGKEPVVQAPEPKGVGADTSRHIKLEEVPAFLDEQWTIFDRSGEGRSARQASDIRDDGKFDENFTQFQKAIEKSQGVKAQVFHAIAENTPVELPGERYLQEDLARHWKACNEVVLKLRTELERWNWIGVTYEPAVRAMAGAKPKKG